MKHKFYLLIVIIFCFHLSQAQIDSRSLFQTPNATGIATSGQIPVDLFTGTPNIDIPLYTYKSRDLSIPIHLTYHPSNIRPTEHASWVGLGWTLQTGGLITRKQNDLPDEYKDYHNSPAYEQGFFYHYDYLTASDWNSGQKLEYNRQVLYASFAMGTGYYYANPYRVDLRPDEFQFNFLDMSGSFFKGQDGDWHFKCKSGLDFQVDMEIGRYTIWNPSTQPAVNGLGGSPSQLNNTITRIILTATDGTQYFFGGDQPTIHKSDGVWDFAVGADQYSVEFCRTGVGVGPGIRDGGIVSTTWYLTKIKSVTGDEISLKYSRDGYQIIPNKYHYGWFYGCDLCSPQMSYEANSGGDEEMSIVDGVSLSGIYGANGSIEFSKSVATILDYQIDGLINAPGLNFYLGRLKEAYYYEEFYIPYYRDPASTFMKLNQIVIKSNANIPLKTFSFEYTEGSTNRLFLNKITEKGSDNTALPSYIFAYNNIGGLANVPYSTSKIDHWGYYNGVDPIQGLYFPPSNGPFLNIKANAYNSTFAATYQANRSPVEALMKYGVLTQITYPTGGSTEFVWEPSNFSKYVNQNTTNFTINIADLAANRTGGGLRIAQIKYNAGFNTPVQTKSYFYYRDYKNNDYLSSGVLNSSLPQYVLEFVTSAYTYRKWSSNNLLPLSYTNGSPITYTNITEVNSDGSFTTYNYSNQDNGYLNTVPTTFLAPLYTSFNLREANTNSMELERGLLLHQNTYKNGSVLLKKIDYQYNDDPNRFNDAIREIYYSRDFAISAAVLSFDEKGFVGSTSGGPVFANDNLFPLYIYTHYPSLKTITETNYDQTGANPSITTSTFTYDNYRNIKTEKFINSKLQETVTSYNYASDNITSLPAVDPQQKTDLLNANMTGIQLEKTSTVNSAEVKRLRTDYKKYENTNTYIIPSNTYQSIHGNALENASEFVNYDSKGNILQYISRNGIPTSFDWDYNQAYPTAKVSNAANTIRTYGIMIPGATFVEMSVPGATTKQFTTELAGQVHLGMGFAYNLSSSLNISYTLTGPNSFSSSGSLCFSTNQSCGAITSNRDITTSTPGLYTLTITSTTINGSISGGYLDISYPTYVPSTTTSGFKEYFYEGFENPANSTNITSGGAHTGNNYYNSSYPVSYTIPNNRSYVIQWWNYNSSTQKWKFNQANYTGSVTLPGPVDDIRIFPGDAQISTYTYTPLLGMTSEIDPSGRETYYDYDVFSRLKIIRDQNNKILKKIDYGYQSQDTYTSTVCNDGTGGNCTDDNRKCVKGFCEKGTRYNVSTTWLTSGAHSNQWKCKYYYQWSDGTQSKTGTGTTYFTDYGAFPCDVVQ